NIYSQFTKIKMYIIIYDCSIFCCNFIKKCYTYIFTNYNITEIKLVDGGCDVILRGNEDNLGTPVEDIMHLKAIYDLIKLSDYSVKIPAKIYCIAMRCDCFDEDNLNRITNFYKSKSVLIYKIILSKDD